VYASGISAVDCSKNCEMYGQTNAMLFQNNNNLTLHGTFLLGFAFVGNFLRQKRISVVEESKIDITLGYDESI
jgi:hypothetical protein